MFDKGAVYVSGLSVPPQETGDMHPSCIVELPFFLDPEISSSKPDRQGDKDPLPSPMRPGLFVNQQGQVFANQGGRQY